jgi:prolyl-tRNA synthetase
MSEFLTKREEDINKWYNDLVIKGGLADYSDVRGCMVIKPYGFAIWEKMRDQLDKVFKETGHVNAYFPLFIPKSYLSKEAAHVEGFAKECAVVTHYRLMNDPNGKGVIVDPDAKLEEELIVRPTSETIIWNSYKTWIQSYRDLPILINQWANVVRWEMRTKLFLRTTEFLWQEGHTAHATQNEAIEETEKMIDVYATFCKDFMSMPVHVGLKTPNERFAGAVETYCIEALMQDGKALQAGTSHFLGQNFPKAFDVKFSPEGGGPDEYVWATSWGVSTRLMGALILTHSDDNGLVLPPKLAPHQVVMVPFLSAKYPEQSALLLDKCKAIKAELNKRGVSVLIDTDETKRPGFKFAEYELKGVPVRLVFGPKDMEAGKIEVARRDMLTKESVNLEGIEDHVVTLLDDIQENLYTKAMDYRNAHSRKVDNWDDFMVEIEKGGMILAHWDGTSETEEKIKELTKATIRCIPLNNEKEVGVCVHSGKPSAERVIFARAH